MPPRTMTAAEIVDLRDTVTNLKKLVEDQQAKIQTLESNGPSERPRNTNALSVLKSPPIPIFKGTEADCTSTKIKAFISNVKRVGRLSNNDEEDKLIQLATCHLHDRASTWITRIEANGDFPETLEELKNEMMKEFVPSNEKAKAQLKLLTFKMRSSLDNHIEDFRELVEICNTPIREAYAFFFMSLPQYLKGKMAEEFPESDPCNMYEVFKCARKYEIAEKWASGSQNTKKENNKQGPEKEAVHKDSNAMKGDRRVLKDEAESWGPAQKGEGRFFIKKDRCCKCGKPNWSKTCKINPCQKGLSVSKN